MKKSRVISFTKARGKIDIEPLLIFLCVMIIIGFIMGCLLYKETSYIVIDNSKECINIIMDNTVATLITINLIVSMLICVVFYCLSLSIVGYPLICIYLLCIGLVIGLLNIFNYANINNEVNIIYTLAFAASQSFYLSCILFMAYNAFYLSKGLSKSIREQVEKKLIKAYTIRHLILMAIIMTASVINAVLKIHLKSIA